MQTETDSPPWDQAEGETRARDVCALLPLRGCSPRPPPEPPTGVCTLREFVQSHGNYHKQGPKEFFDMALQICRLLQALHQAGGIYGNVSATTVAIDTNTRTISLIDFTCAFFWSEAAPPAALQRGGDPLAASPEQWAQTHTHKRCLDYRTDLYSLGALLYEMLAGSSPFEEVPVGSLEVAHCEVAPPPLRMKLTHTQWEGSLGVCDIIHKLLEKSPCRRYCSVDAANWDLTYLSQMEARNSPCSSLPSTPPGWEEGSFSSLKTSEMTWRAASRLLGRGARRSFLKLPTEVVGCGDLRDRVVDYYHSAFHGTRNVVIFIEGSSGLGKSTLAQLCAEKIRESVSTRRNQPASTEVYASLTNCSRQKGVIVAKGKFEQIMGAQPHGALTQVLEQMLLSCLDAYGRKALVTVMRSYLNSFALQILVEQLIPSLGRLFPRITDAPLIVLSADENRTRLEDALKTWLTAIAQLNAPYPLTVVLDDLQWATETSISLLRAMILSGTQGALFILLQRPTERVPHCYPVHTFREKLESRDGIRTQHLLLRGLQLSDFEKIFADMAGSDSNASLVELMTLLHRHTEGNPFYFTQIVSYLYCRHLLSYNRVNRSWACDLALIKEELSGSQVIDLILSQIAEFEEETRHLLQLASASDSSFSIQFLSRLTEQSERQIALSLRFAVYRGFIMLVPQARSLTYNFTHDRIQEGFYKSMRDDEHRFQTHFRIGRFLLALLDLDQPSTVDLSVLFNALKNLNLARRTDVPASLLWKHLRANQLGWHRAAETGSIVQSLNLAQFSVSLFAHYHASTDEYRLLRLDCYRIMCECRFLLGDLEGANEAYDLALGLCDTKVERIELGMLRMRQFNIQSDFRTSLQFGVSLLNEMGAPDLYAGMPMSVMFESAKKLEAAIEARGGISCFDRLPRVNDEVTNLFHRLTSMVMPPSFLTSDFTLYGLVPVLSALRSLEHGVTSLSSIPLGYLSVALQGFIAPSPLAVDIGRTAWKLAVEFNDPFAMANTAVNVLAVQSMNDQSDLHSLEAIYREGLESALKVHDLNMYGYMEVNLMWNLEFFQMPREQALEVSLRAYKSVQLYKKVDSLIPSQGAYYGAHLLLYGTLPSPLDPACLDVRFLTEAQIDKQSDQMSNAYYLSLMKAYLVLEDRERTLHFWHILKPKLALSKGVAVYYEGVFWIAAVALVYQPLSPADTDQLLADSLEELLSFERVAPSHYGMVVACLRAESAWRQNSAWEEVVALYEAGIASARKAKRYHTAAFMVERMSLYYQSRGLHCLTPNLAELAETLYFRYGALAKCALMQKNSAHNAPTRARKHLENLSKTISTGQDLQTVMQLIVEILRTDCAAEKGYLFLVVGPTIYLLLEWHEDEMALHPLPGSARQAHSLGLARVKDRVPVRIIEHVCSVKSASQSLVDHQLSLFMKEHGAQSLACLPVQNSRVHLGALFLENDSQVNAFHTRRSVLDHLVAQLVPILEYHYSMSILDHAISTARQRNTQLQVLNHMKDYFVQAVSMELTVPLRSILEYADALRDGLCTQEQIKILKMLSSSARGLLLVINDIVDFQSCQQNKLTMTLAPFDLHEMLEECKYFVPPKANVTVELHCASLLDSTALLVEGDERRLKQVLHNLLSNAVKFTDQGTVTLTCHPQLPLPDALPAPLPVAFSVRDTGIGISPSAQGDLFKAFSQVDRSTTRRHSGTGLGLALSQLIVAKMSNDTQAIHCCSEVDRGSEFSFILPLTLLRVNPT